MSEYFFTHKWLMVEKFDADGDMAFIINEIEYNSTTYIPRDKVVELRDWLTEQLKEG